MERLKSLFCIHKFVQQSSRLGRGGMAVYLYCVKCGKGKSVLVKHPDN